MRNPLPTLVGVGAILHTADDLYLMQLRDDRPEVSMANHWGLFGGIVEEGERPERALLRELKEELAFVPLQAPAWFTEISCSLDFLSDGTHHKIFYAAEISAIEIPAMRLGEGQEMRLFRPDELLSRHDVIPWDAFGIMLFTRRAQIASAFKRRSSMP